jgi:hypothetical protein
MHSHNLLAALSGRNVAEVDPGLQGFSQPPVGW